ncbi:CBS domain-containing protein [Paraburkholderia lycopersici]|uniref:BON domain-containing protein n=1 Tax=Paraburkholderia lycopersici TaxID=416944 RepID=A0A1G6SEU1_9BURK|nr:CBS domain-containing protein [Paraburkholderia lycopersici]SDD15388.1 BON domain-containing protein [Paraburkholderia lycopersici]
MQASDIMTTDVITVRPNASIFEAATLLTEHHISGIPVVDDGGAVVGILSESDLLHRVETGTGKPQRSWLGEFLHSTRKLAGEYLKENAVKVGDVMTSNVVSVSPSTPLSDIADLLARLRIKRVPVIDQGKLVGIVSRANLIRALADASRPDEAGLASDETIHRHVLHALDGHRWAMAADNVVVKEGIVHFWGTVNSEEERKAILVSAERVPGVKGIEDHLGYPVVFTPM